jgi:dTDP-4-amino-4,6-dideoxygalactose transaminase
MGVKHTLLCCSGTAALQCAYAGLHVGPGDEVIIPGFTWIASACAPLSVGAIPVIVDVDESLMMAPDAIERAITPRTKVINAVHMSGFMADMGRIMKIARKHKLLVVEDACQCDGGYWRDGRRAGAIGHAGAYSFNWYKVISCGDSGAFVTNDRETFERGVQFHNGGEGLLPGGRKLSIPPFAGVTLRGNEILAAIMRVQLRRLPGIIRDLHRVRARIRQMIEGAPGVMEIPCNGGDTGTGAYLGLRFADERAARAFVAAFKAHAGGKGVSVWLPIDSGRHVYWNWDAVLAKRGAWCEAANPYKHPANARSRVRYSKGMLPQTLAILKRTVLIGMNPDWSTRQVEGVAKAVRAAGK